MPPIDIQLVSIPVSDQDRAKRFYERVLGFEVLADRVVTPTMRWIQLRPAAATMSVSLVTWFPTMEPGSVRGLVIGSDDLDTDVDRLEDHGVDVGDGIVEEPWGRYVAFTDPDGNGLVLQSLTPAA